MSDNEATEVSESVVEDNYALFRDHLSSAVVQLEAAPAERPKPRRRRRAKAAGIAKSTPNSQQDAEDLSDFIDYLASSIFESFPADLKSLDYRSWRESEELQKQFSLPLAPDSLSGLDLPPPIPDTLLTYGLVAPDPTLDSALPPTTEQFLAPIITTYIETLTAPPPAAADTRADACEICGRHWIPLSYHHLIPRFVHEKVVKRGWHRREDLQNVAWLCGACHRFVHHFKKHEDLARYYYTVDLLLAEDEVRRFAAWAGKLRWKGGKVRAKP